LQEKLKLGIEAARRGDNNAAQILLRQVVAAEPNNELGWMWLASVADSVTERRMCLERALKINPNNTRAQEALRRLGGSSASSAPRQAARREIPASAGGSRVSTVIIGAFLAVLVLAAIIFGLVYLQQTTTTTEPQNQVTVQAALNPPITPTIDPDTYTATPFFGVIVTRSSENATLPPTFTPTDTPPPPATLTPSPTPYPVESFTILVNSIAPGEGAPGLFQSLADGSNEQGIGTDVRDMVFDPSGEKVAFIREVAGTTTTVSSNDDETPDPDSTEEAPVTVTSGPSTELFIAPVNDLGAARQVTTLGGRVSHPTWAPNGIQLAFTHETGEDAEIWVITEDGNNLRQITENESNDRDPDWSPDGNNIVFVSDQNSPGLTKVFTMSPDGTEVTQLDQRAGSSYSPRWSQDGEYIVFVNDEGGDGDLYIMEADGENVFLLTPDDGGAEDRSPVFSPDDNWIGFVSNRDGATFQTYLVDRRGNTPIRVTNTDRDDQAVDFRPELLLRLRQN
jgi:hypothetical protein